MRHKIRPIPKGGILQMGIKFCEHNVRLSDLVDS